MAFSAAKSKTDQIADYLRGELARLRAAGGSKVPSSRALAGKFKASQMVARKAFERLEDEGLIERRHGSGTYIREGGASARHVAIINEIDISHPDVSYYYVRIIQQLRLFFDRRMLPVRLYLGHCPPNRAFDDPSLLAECELLRDIEKGLVSGIIALAGPMNDKWEKPLLASGLPVVGANPCFSCGIDPDPGIFVEKGLELLIQDGCRKPFIICNQRDVFRLFLSEAKARGITFPFDCPRPPRFPRHDIEGFGYSSVMRIFAGKTRDFPDGLLFTDDIVFKDALIGMLQIGLRIPEKLKIVTHYNKGSGIFMPFPAKLLVTDPDIIAEKYGELLLDILEGRQLPGGRIKMPFEVVAYKPTKISSRRIR